MAKDKDKFTGEGTDDDEFDFDALDSELDGDDDSGFDASGDRPTGKRKPISKFSIKEVAKSAASVETLQQIGAKVGDEFGSIGKAYGNTINTLSDLEKYRQDAMKGIAPTISQAKRVSRMYLPKVEKMLPKGLYEKLGSLVKASEENGPQSEAEARDAVISSSIAEIFESQQAIAKDQYVNSRADAMIQSKLQIGQHQESTTVLYQIRNLVKSNQLFFEGTFRKYLMKSLELKYKMLFITKDILEKNTLQSEILESKLEAIKINTGLPDVVKRHKSEEVGQMMRERLYGSALSTVGEWTSGFKKNMLENVKTKVFEMLTNTINDIGGGMLEGAEMMEESAQMNEELGIKSKSPMTKLGSFLVKKLMIDTGVVSLKAGVGKQNFTDLDSMVKEFSAELPYKLQELAASRDDFLGDFLKTLIPAHDSTALENILDKRGTEEVSFDVITRRSIVEIIPGFLAKINQQATITANAVSLYLRKKLPDSGREVDRALDVEEQIFDRSSENFLGATEFKAKTMEKLFGTQEKRTEGMQGIVDQLYAGYTKRSKNDAQFKESLPDIIRFIGNLSKHNKIVQPARILKYLNGGELNETESTYLDLVLEDIPEKARKQLARVLAKSFFKNMAQEELDKNVTADTGKLFRRLAIDNDEYKKHLNDTNAYGGKRHLDNVIHKETEGEYAKDIEKLRQTYIKKYTLKKFERDESLQAEFRRDVEELKQRQGINFNAVRDIQSDVDQSKLLSKAAENKERIQSKWAIQDADRKRTTRKTVVKRTKAAVVDDFKDKLKPVTDFLDQHLPRWRGKKARTITPKQADDITEETGLPNRDEVQISGPGAYFQGAARELHIPLDGKIDAITDKLKTVKRKAVNKLDWIVSEAQYEAYQRGWATTPAEFKKLSKDKLQQLKDIDWSAKAKSLGRDVKRKTNRMIGEAQYQAYQHGVPSNVKELKEAVAKKSEELGLTKQYAKLTTSIKALNTKYKITDKVAELKAKIKDKDAELKLTEMLGKKYQELKVKAKKFDLKSEVALAKRTVTKKLDWIVSEAQYEAYQRGWATTPAEFKKLSQAKLAELKATDWKAKAAELKTSGRKMYQDAKDTDWKAKAAELKDVDWKAKANAVKREVTGSKMYQDASDSKIAGQARGVKRTINRKLDWIVGEAQYEAYQRGWATTPEEFKKLSKEKLAELKATDWKAKANTVKRNVKNKANWMVGEAQYQAYQHGLPSSTGEIKKEAKAKMDEAIDFAKGKYGFLKSLIPEEQLKVLQSTFANQVSSVKSSVKSMTSTGDGILGEIKQMLADQFTTANQFSTSQLNVNNQILMTLASGQILGSGGEGAAATQKVGIIKRMMAGLVNAPGRALVGAGKLAGRGMGAYLSGTIKFYKGLLGVTVKALPSMVRGAGSIVGAGLGVGNKIVPQAGKLMSSLLGAYFGVAGTIMSGLWKGTTSIGKITGGVLKTLFTPRDEYADVYRKDEVDQGKPLMKGSDIQEGKYVDGDGKPLKNSLSIKGPIFDAKTKKVVVSAADLKHGLVDAKNDPLNKSRLSGLGFELARRGAIGYGKFLMGTAKLGMKAVGGVFKGVKSLFGASGNGADAATINQGITQHLVQLVSLVTDIKKLVAPKKIREGGYDDYFNDRAAANAKKRVRARDLSPAARAKAAGAGGIGGILGSVLGGKKGAPGSGEAGDSIGSTILKYGTGAVTAVTGAGFVKEKIKDLFGIGKKAKEAKEAADALKAAEALKTAKTAATGVDAAADVAGAAKKPGILGRALSSMKSAGSSVIDMAKNSKLAEAAGSKLTAAKELAKTGISKIPGASILDKGKGLLKSAAKSPIGKFATGKLAKTAGMSIAKKVALGAVGAVVATGAAVGGVAAAVPIGVALTVAGLATTGYDIYSWARGSNRRKMTTKLRNEAYHVPEDLIKVLIKFEDEIAESMGDDGESMSADDAKGFIKEFGLDPKNAKHFEYFRFWYIEAFMPVFQFSVDLFGKDFGVKFEDHTDLTNKQLDEYQAQLNGSDKFNELKSSGYPLTVEAANGHKVEEESGGAVRPKTAESTLPKASNAKEMANQGTKSYLSRAKDAAINMKDSAVSAAHDVTGAVSDFGNSVAEKVNGMVGGGTYISDNTPKDWAGPYGDPSNKYNELANRAAFRASAIETRGGTMKDRKDSQYRGEFQIGYDMQKELGLSNFDMGNRELVRARVVNKYAQVAEKLAKDGIPVTEAGIYTAWQQGYGGYKQIYRAAQNGTEVSPEIRRNMDANLPHTATGKMSPGTSPAAWLAGWENNKVASLSAKGETASTNPIQSGAASGGDSLGTVATTATSPTPMAVPATQSGVTTIAAKSAPVVSPASAPQPAIPDPNLDKQTALLSEQNSLLKQMTMLLGGINKNTETDPKAQQDKTMVAKLGDLIDTLKSKSAGAGQQVASTVRSPEQSNTKSGGINLQRQEFAVS